jgi:hypothetical protein
MTLPVVAGNQQYACGHAGNRHHRRAGDAEQDPTASPTTLATAAPAATRHCRAIMTCPGYRWGLRRVKLPRH